MEESSALVAELQRQKGFRYPSELKARAGAYIRGSRGAGKTWRAIHEELGLPKETVRRWAELSGESGKLQPVRTTLTPTSTPSSTPSYMTLVSPMGWRLENIDGVLASQLFCVFVR